MTRSLVAGQGWRRPRCPRRTPRGWLITGFVLGVGLVTTSAVAQSADAPDSLATITTDTGAYAPPRAGYVAQFTTPGVCAAAVEYAQYLAHRTVASQMSLQRATRSVRDTLPASVRSVVQGCGARFTVAQTAEPDVMQLFRLALAAGDDRLARTIITRQVAHATTAVERERILTDATARYLAPTPALPWPAETRDLTTIRTDVMARARASTAARVSEAEWAVALADTVAQRELADPLEAHAALLEYWTTLFDVPQMRQSAEQMLTAARKVPMESMMTSCRYLTLELPYISLLKAAYFAHPDSLLTTVARAKIDIGRYPQDCANFDINYQTASATQVLELLLPFGDVSTAVGGMSINVAAGTGLPLTKQSVPGLSQAPTIPTVSAAYWFPRRPDFAPSRGTVSLVVYGGGCGHWGDCALQEQSLPLLISQYGTRGLALTLVDRTQGWAAQSLPLTPAMEADTLNWLYRTYYGLPLTLAVVPQTVTWSVPLPDGRREFKDTTALGMLHDRLVGSGLDRDQLILAVLYNRNGTLLYAGRFDYPLLDALIARAMNASVASQLTPGTGTSLHPTTSTSTPS